MHTPVIIWFRQDLRLSDNPALIAALENGAPIIPLYIHDTSQNPAWGGASLWWLHYSLTALDASLQKLGGGLILRRGDPLKIIPQLMQETNATSIYLNRCYEPYAVARDTALKQQLTDNGHEYFSFKANLLFEPWEIKNQQEKPYGVFTPFWKACLTKGDMDAPLPVPKKINFAGGIKTEKLSGWKFLPTKPDWAGGMRNAWEVGEFAAQKRLREFLDHELKGYAGGRDRPDQNHVSRLSPHLHWGEISARQIFYAVDVAVAQNHSLGRDAEKFKSEIGWREFSYSLLFHNPNLSSEPLQQRFRNFPWHENKKHLHAWQRGQTGYPIIDAGMRELWATGYMHNRVRMIVASFLVKNLLQPWQHGEAWFWDTLCDADLANNSASWQWVAGCGADAAPYFRVFNPVLQGEKFDPDGNYIRRWVPELKAVPNRWLHKPWQMETPPKDYPVPIVDLLASRDRALKAFQMLKETGDET